MIDIAMHSSTRPVPLSGRTEWNNRMAFSPSGSCRKGGMSGRIGVVCEAHRKVLRTLHAVCEVGVNWAGWNSERWPVSYPCEPADWQC